MGNMEPKMLISYNQKSLLVEGLGHQPRPKTYDPQFVLPTVYAGGKDRSEIEGLANQWLAQLETHGMREPTTDTINDILLILQTEAYHHYYLSGFTQQ